MLLSDKTCTTSGTVSSSFLVVGWSQYGVLKPWSGGGGGGGGSKSGNGQVFFPSFFIFKFTFLNTEALQSKKVSILSVLLFVFV